MATRGDAAQFVAVRVGFWTDPLLVLGLARELRVPPGEAGSYVLRWEEFVLTVGDARSGRVKGYTLTHLAVAVGWRGKTERLAEALKAAGVLRVERGGALVHPYWRETRTGHYALGRAVDARRKELARDHARGDHEGAAVEECPKCKPPGQGADSPDSVRGQGADSLRRSGDQEIKVVPGTPPSPPQGGDSKGHARWKWMLENAPNPQNDRACLEMLESMSDENWALVQAAYGRLRPERGPLDGRKKRVLEWPTDKFLSKGAYRQFRPRKASKPLHVNGAAKMVQAEPPKPTKEEVDRSIVLAKLASPMHTLAAKRKAVEDFNLAYPDNPVPMPPEPS